MWTNSNTKYNIPRYARPYKRTQRRSASFLLSLYSSNFLASFPSESRLVARWRHGRADAPERVKVVAIGRSRSLYNWLTSKYSEREWETQRRQRRGYVMQSWFWHMAVRALSQRKHAVGSIYTVTHAFNVAVSCRRRRRRRCRRSCRLRKMRSGPTGRPDAHISLAKTSHTMLWSRI